MNESGPSSPNLRLQVYTLRVASTLGAAVSLMLVGQHIDYAINGALESSLCQVGGWFDCEAIEASGYASFFQVPVASVGVFYFVLLGLLSWFVPPQTGSEGAWRWQGLFGGLTLPALAVVWGLAMLSALVIESFCLGCTIIYTLTLICAAAAVLAGPRQYLRSVAGTARMLRPTELWSRARHPEGRFRMAMVLGGILLGALVNFGVPVWIIQQSAATPVVIAYLEQPVVELTPPRRGLSEGNPDAPLQIIVFTDFACPFCARFEKDLSKLLVNREGAYFLGFKHYPLSRQCNPIMKHASFDHANACRLAQMGEALADLGHFSALRDELYTSGDADLYPLLKAVALKAGIDYGMWAARAIDPAIKERVERDIQEGLKLDIRALPSVYVNGRPLPSIDPAKVDRIFNAIENADR